MIDHIYPPVSDLKRSSEFYKKMLEPLGIDMPYKFDRLFGFAINGEPGFWLKTGDVAKDLYVAFTARARTLSGPATRLRSTPAPRQSKNRACGPNGAPTTSRRT